MDRRANVREVVGLLMALEKQAQGVGGRVVSLLGNHDHASDEGPRGRADWAMRM